MVRPVDADVVNLVLAVAQMHNTVDDAPRVGGERSFRRLIRVVPLVVPSTRTSAPVVMALAEVELAPFWYVVEDASLTVTF